MQPDRIDFSSLDPSTESARWEAMVRTVALRAAAGRNRPLVWQLSAWTRPALALAAAAVLLAWAPTLFVREQASSATSGGDAALALSEWEVSPSSTSASEVLSSLGAAHEQ